MKLELVQGSDDAAAAARLAATAAHVDDEATARRMPWWRAGVEEATAAREISRPPATAADARLPARYAVPSPRRTRGATRA